ncbi:MAG: cytochrome c [Myxococcota bacterium]|nr:cytochrome c [Myxococcota bacterium]
MRSRVGKIELVLLAAFAAACSNGSEATVETAAVRGERIYKNVCIACHNANPALDGSVGPAVAGASYELLEARVVHGNYPEGYSPKNAGGVMPKFPYLKDSIGDLAAYLAEAARAKGSG